MKFKDLNEGQVFEFSGSGKYGTEPGPWVKVGKRSYMADSILHRMNGLKIEVGTVNAEVCQADPPVM